MQPYKRNFILAASLILSAGAAFPQASAPAPAKQERKMAKALNLTDAQKEQAKAIRQRHSASNKEIRTQMHDLRQQHRDAKQANNTAELQRLTEQRTAVKAKAKEAWSAQRAELRSILNADQQAKFDQMAEKRGRKR